MGTFETLQNLPLMQEHTKRDKQAGTKVSVTPEDIETAVYAQQQPTSPLQLETLDAEGTTPSSPTKAQTDFVPKVSTPKVPISPKQLDNGSTNSGKQQEDDEPEL